jgi:hypothetical protein
MNAEEGYLVTKCDSPNLQSRKLRRKNGVLQLEVDVHSEAPSVHPGTKR